jgi:cytochrome c peroxidase
MVGVSTRKAQMIDLFRTPVASFAGLTSLLLLSACGRESKTEQLSTLAPAELQAQLRLFDLRPLSHEPIPRPIGGHIVDERAAIRLGKAFFWDVQAGGDGQMACASCHVTGGSDARRLNTLNPGLDGIFASGGVTGPGQLYTPVLITNDDIVGVQGVATALFDGINADPTVAADHCTPINFPPFGFQRRVEFRQAPMIYGAAFLRQLFWGGEASDDFNGITIWGLGPNSGGVRLTHVRQAALESQAVGPINNFEEMTCFGRPLNGPDSLGAKLLARQPLQHQRVSTSDSVLGRLANRNGPGLVCDGAPCTYRELIEEAFGPTLAAAAESQFTIIWGESVAAYQRTLIPDQTPFDRFMSGHLTAMTPKQIFGLVTFLGRGNCATCHAGPFFSDATYRFAEENGLINRDGGDQGFHNIGMLNSNFDRGRGDFGPGGAQFSVSGSQFDNFAFKTPTVRNVKLTAPYFHTGSQPTLADVVEFYDRGGDFPNPELSADIFPLNLTAFEKSALVDFMENALTDCRVEKRRAPFDHPQISVPNGPSLPAIGRNGIGNCPN